MPMMLEWPVVSWGILATQNMEEQKDWGKCCESQYIQLRDNKIYTMAYSLICIIMYNIIVSKDTGIITIISLRMFSSHVIGQCMFAWHAAYSVSSIAAHADIHELNFTPQQSAYMWYESIHSSYTYYPSWGYSLYMTNIHTIMTCMHVCTNMHIDLIELHHSLYWRSFIVEDMRGH